MGFPIGYTEVYLPKILIYVLTCLGFIRKLISVVFHLVGLKDFLEQDFWSTDTTRTESLSFDCYVQSASGLLIREVLSVVEYADLVDPPESCAVCLHEFDGGDEIRLLTNCRHVFHKCCLDRWMDHGQMTCPLCRTLLIPDGFQESFNERLWAASGIGEYYDEPWAISS